MDAKGKLMSTPKGPVLIDLDDNDSLATPADAPPIPEVNAPAPTGQAMATVAALSTRKPSRLAKWFWGLLLSLIGTVVSVAAWNFVTGLITSTPILGFAVAALLAAFGLVALAVILKELAVFSRLKRIDRLHRDAEEALASENLGAARKVTGQLMALYAGRDDTRWGRDGFAKRQEDVFDAEGLLGLAESEILSPLDLAARKEVEAAARQVATVTALVPLALADVVAALTSNIRMIRRIGEIYGGRSGTLGSLRLTRAVMGHLVATGAVAVGDDMLEPILGAGLLGKLSRRFGEGLVNGALTARVGVAAIEVCRPLPFRRTKRPSVKGIIKTSLTGLFSPPAKSSKDTSNG
jgi:putative membrane protein